MCGDCSPVATILNSKSTTLGGHFNFQVANDRELGFVLKNDTVVKLHTNAI